MRLSDFDAAAVNRLIAEMRAEAEAIVKRGAGEGALAELRSAFMRYRGQGHEIAVELPVREFNAADSATFTGLFEAAYRKLYSRSIPGAEIEVLSWAVALSAPAEGRLAAPAAEQPSEPEPRLRRRLFDPGSGEIPGRSGLSALRTCTRSMHEGARSDRRGRHLDRHQSALRRAHRRIWIY